MIDEKEVRKYEVLRRTHINSIKTINEKLISLGAELNGVWK